MNGPKMPPLSRIEAGIGACAGGGHATDERRWSWWSSWWWVRKAQGDNKAIYRGGCMSFSGVQGGQHIARAFGAARGGLTSLLHLLCIFFLVLRAGSRLGSPLLCLVLSDIGEDVINVGSSVVVRCVGDCSGALLCLLGFARAGLFLSLLVAGGHHLLTIRAFAACLLLIVSFGRFTITKISVLVGFCNRELLLVRGPKKLCRLLFFANGPMHSRKKALAGDNESW